MTIEHNSMPNGGGLLSRVFDDENYGDEETLLEISIDAENLRATIFDKKYLRQDDSLKKILNFTRRLGKVEEKVVDLFLTEKPSIISFLFDILAQKFEDIGKFTMMEIDDLHLSVYDHCAAILCSFITFLNEEQIQTVINILLENLLSPIFVKPLIASDLLVFTCRLAGEQFCFDVFTIVFSLLDEIYFENSENVELGYLYAQQTQNILVSLLDRLIVYLDEDHLASLLEEIAYESHNHIYDRLNLSRLPQSLLPNSPSFMKCLEVFKTNDNIPALIAATYLDVGSLMQAPMLLSLLECLRNVWRITNKHSDRFVLQTLQAINSIAHQSIDEIEDASRLERVIDDILSNLSKHCIDNFVLTQSLFITLQNLACSGLVANLLASDWSRDVRFKNHFKLYLRFYQASKFVKSEERELYIEKQSREYFNLLEMDCNQFYRMQNSLKLSDIPETIENAVLEDSSNLDNRLRVLSDMQYTLSIYQDIDNLDIREFECFQDIQDKVSLLISKF